MATRLQDAGAARTEGAVRAARAALLLLLAAAGAGAVQEDRPLPPSPCPGVFSYEGATVDWDRWYGEVLVATDIPLTGLRLDVWLSRPALALRHNWDGNVTTLDNKRFTILNLYKRIEPGPPKSVRIVVKFDDHKEVPVLGTIELNGRRICSDTYETAAQPMSAYKPRPDYQEERPSSYQPAPPPSNSKYDFDRTTRRPYESPDAHRNIVSKRPPSDYLNSQEQQRAPPRVRLRPQEDPYSGLDEISTHRDTAPRTRPDYEQDQSTYPESRPLGTAPRGQPVFADVAPPPGSRKPPGGGGGKLSAGPPGSRAPPPPPPGRSKPGRRPDASPLAEDVYYRPPPPPPAMSRPADPRRPGAKDEDSVVYADRPPPRTYNAGGARTPAEDPAIDVRFNSGAQPLSDDFYHHSTQDYGDAGRPTRQGNGKDPAWVPPGHRQGGGNGNGNGKGQENAGGPPGLSGSLPPAHGGPVPDHKNKGNGGSDNYNNEDNYNNKHDGWNQPEVPERPPSTYRPESSTWRNSGPARGHECGRTLTVAPLVTHGQNTSRGQWPWHAALYQNKGADLKYICGGTLISPKYVITAAHCVTRSTTGRAVDPDTIIAYLGKYHLHRWTNEEGVQQGKVAAIHVHPDYNTTDFRGDLALLEFSTALTYTQYVRHVCSWGSDESNELKYVVGQEGYVVGWGYTEHGELTEELRMGTMPVVDQQTCIWSYPDFFSRFTNNMTFCAGYKNGTSACNGDSGGGLVMPRQRSSGKVWYLRGLVSTSVAQEEQRVCNTDHYVVFTDLAKYRNWIASYVH